MDKHHIPAELVRPPFPTPTVLAAAEAMGVGPDAIIKSVLFILRRAEPLLVIASGQRLIDKKIIASHLEIGKKQVKIAKPEEVLHWTGFPAGGVPPFGHPQPLRTWIDPAVLEQDLIYGGGGDENTLMRLRAADLLAPTKAEIVSVCSDQ